MSVRAKLFSAMVVLIVFMTGVFFVISHVYMENMFRQFAVATREADAQQWAVMLSYYYQKNGGTWRDVDKYVRQINEQKLSSGRETGLERLAIVDQDHHVIYSSKTSPHITQKEILSHGVEAPIIVGGRKIATLSVLDRDLEREYRLQEKILQSMAKAAMTGAVATGLVALLIGAWLTRRLTRPLQLLLDAIQRISQGDLRLKLPTDSRDEFGRVASAFNQMADQLAKAQEVRRHLVADVAHELRTPLTIIQGQLELIQQGVRKPDPETLLPIQDECMRLSRLVDDLHQLTLAEAGVLPLEVAPVDIVSLVQRVVDNFQVEADERDIRLAMRAESETAYAAVDANRMTQVFVNLVGNAIRYTPAGGRVTVVVREERGEVQIAVEDTGPGISEEHLPHLFDRFYRVEEARSRGNGGTGLGLAIAKEFVEAHKGRIEVKSQVGAGTVFTVFVPALRRWPQERASH
ncbi:MAG: HAMP domain-containing protein [Alicyclobacillaceae bacterium]|nr:HAMP domain-containing protein [Alicyclobacillaceae bacterium]